MDHKMQESIEQKKASKATFSHIQLIFIGNRHFSLEDPTWQKK